MLVIQLAGYARNMIVPDNETLQSDVFSTYNALESCCRLGVPKITLASSVCIYGVTYAASQVEFPFFSVGADLR